MSDVKETGFFINAVKQTPAKAGISMITEDTPGAWCLYEIKLNDQEKIHFYLDPFSRVDFDPSLYRNLAGFSKTPLEAFAVVTLENAFSHNDMFHGYVVLEYVATDGCTLDNCTVECEFEDVHETYGLKNAMVQNSTVKNSETPSGIMVTESSTLQGTVIKAKGLATIIASELKGVWLRGEDDVTLCSTKLNGGKIEAEGPVRINRCTLGGVEIDTAGSLNFDNPFGYFHVDFNEWTGFNFYRAAKGTYMVAIAGSGWELDVADPKLSERLLKETRFWEIPMIEAAVEHLVDSVKSRVKVIEMMEAKQGQNTV